MANKTIDQAKIHAEQALASLALIGDGDYTPQDAHTRVLVRDVENLVAELTDKIEKSKLHSQEQRDSADRLRMAIERENFWKEKAGYHEGRATAFQSRLEDG